MFYVTRDIYAGKFLQVFIRPRKLPAVLPQRVASRPIRFGKVKLYIVGAVSKNLWEIVLIDHFRECRDITVC